MKEYCTKLADPTRVTDARCTGTCAIVEMDESVLDLAAEQDSCTAIIEF